MHAQVLGPAAQEQRVGRDRADRQDDGQGCQRLTPAFGLHQPARQRDENRAGKAGHQGDDRQCADALTLEPAGRGGEGRVVQRRGHGQADCGPDQVELLQAGDLRPGQDEQRRDDRADGHEQARPVAIQPAADGDGGQSGQQQGE